MWTRWPSFCSDTLIIHIQGIRLGPNSSFVQLDRHSTAPEFRVRFTALHGLGRGPQHTVRSAQLQTMISPVHRNMRTRQQHGCCVSAEMKVASPAQLRRFNLLVLLSRALERPAGCGLFRHLHFYDRRISNGYSNVCWAIGPPAGESESAALLRCRGSGGTIHSKPILSTASHALPRALASNTAAALRPGAAVTSRETESNCLCRTIPPSRSPSSYRAFPWCDCLQLCGPVTGGMRLFRSLLCACFWRFGSGLLKIVEGDQSLQAIGNLQVSDCALI